MFKEVIRRVHPHPSLESTPTRYSIHSVGHLTMPSLRWWDGKTPTHHKSSLLGLKLSSKTFLDTSLEDDLSGTAVYTIKTIEASTVVLRNGNEGNPLEIAKINWPGALSPNEAREDDNFPLIKMKDCRWSEGPVFLRSGSNPNSSRKFTIPDYSHTMKWKRYGTSYWCTTPGIKGPIATLDLAKGQEPISMMVYETLRDKNDSSKVLPSFKGVSFLLLDYLIVTALLCVTDVSAWTEVGAMQDIAFWNKTNSGQELDVVSRFSDCSSVVWSRELHRKASETSLVTTVSAYPQSPSRLHGSETPTPEKSRSMWYTDTPTIKDSFKAFLHSTLPNASTDSLLRPGSSASHTPAKRPIHGSRNKPSLLSRPSTSASCTSTSSSFKPELPHSLDQPTTTTNIHSSQQPPFDLDNKESLPSEQLPNDSKSSNTSNGSESYRRPLPKPPRESILRRTQSSIPSSTATRSRSFRSLPPTPFLELSEQDESNRIQSRSPPMKKVPPELAQWLLLPNPSPASVAFDVPPSYSSIYSVQEQEGDKQNSITTPTTSATSTST